jgi:hypothetical protein
MRATDIASVVTWLAKHDEAKATTRSPGER